jgi:hypothetical protein
VQWSWSIVDAAVGWNPSACELRRSRSRTSTTARGAARNSPGRTRLATITQPPAWRPRRSLLLPEGPNKSAPAADSLVVRTNLSSERRGLREALAHPGGEAAEDAMVELKRSSCSVGRAATSAVIDETPEMDESRQRSRSPRRDDNDRSAGIATASPRMPRPSWKSAAATVPLGMVTDCWPVSTPREVGGGV